MMSISDNSLQDFKDNLLDRLRLSISSFICGEENRLASDTEVRLFFLKQYQSDPILADILFDLLHVESTTPMDWSEIGGTEVLTELAQSFDQHPLEPRMFVELLSSPPPFASPLGLLIKRKGIEAAGHVYAITFIEKHADTIHITYRLELHIQPREGISVSDNNGVTKHGFDSFDSSLYARAAVGVLRELTHRRPYRPMTPQEVLALNKEIRDHHEPPDDPRLTELLHKLLLGVINCKRAACPLSDIRPYSIDFCLLYPIELIDSFKTYLKEGKFDPPMLVYWNQDHFLMSDDYSLYLAHRSMETTTVPIVILGDTPPHIHVAEEGGPELLPPVITDSYSIYSWDPDRKEAFLAKRLKQSSGPPSLLGLLYALHIQLSLLLQKANVSERMLHNFLQTHQIALSPLGLRLETEVSLSRKYRVDLLMQTPGLMNQTFLIELESPRKAIFTKSGRPRSTTTHAIQQVEDWLRWWSEHPNEIPLDLESSLPPHGIVVIGRSDKLSEENRIRLAHLNRNRAVQVMTYDELSLQLEAYIRNLEDLQSWSSSAIGK